MRFLDQIEVLDRIEGDKLAVVVVELHVEEPLLGALSSCMTFLHRIEGDKLAVVVVELRVGPRRSCDALDKQNQVFVVFCQV